MRKAAAWGLVENGRGFMGKGLFKSGWVDYKDFMYILSVQKEGVIFTRETTARAYAAAKELNYQPPNRIDSKSFPRETAKIAEELPMVMIANRSNEANLSGIELCSKKLGQVMTRHLYALGHRRTATNPAEFPSTGNPRYLSGRPFLSLSHFTAPRMGG